MPQANIGTANYAAYFGVPATTVTWTGRSTTSRSGTIFTAVDITQMADESDTRDNQGEIQAERTRNDRIQYRFSVKPIAANAAAALVIAGDLPKKNSIITITSDATETDISVSGTILVKESSKSYTPEGEAVVNLTCVKHVGKTFASLS